MRDELRRMALFGSGVAELTRHRAEQIVKDLVKSGDVRRDQAASLVKELLDRSRDTRTELLAFVRAEIRNQIQSLGVASEREMTRLDRRVTRLEDRVKEQAETIKSLSATQPATAKKTRASKKTTAQKKESPRAKKSTGRGAKKSAAKQTSPEKPPADG